MNRTAVWLLLVSAGEALLAGCQADPDSWQGGLKFLNVHAVAFTPDGQGLLMVGPRRDSGELNGAAYYYLHLPTMKGHRLGYGQYSLGQALLCPFDDLVAVPSYMAGDVGQPNQPGYDLYRLRTGQLLRRQNVDDPALFVGHECSVGSAATGPAGTTTANSLPPAGSQPDEGGILAAWEAALGQPLTSRQMERIVAFRPRWVSRGCGSGGGIAVVAIDGQAFYELGSPDGRHRLYIRFNAPSHASAKAADPDGEGYAYGFLHDPLLGSKHMIYTTSGAEQTFDDIGSAVFGGPVWLIRQPIRWFRRN